MPITRTAWPNFLRSVSGLIIILYTPDLNAILNGTEAYFENLDCWIIDALRPIQHPSHFSLQDAFAGD